MKKLWLRGFLTMLLLLLQSTVSFAQHVGEKITRHQVETIDGNQFSGELIDEDEEQMRLRTEGMGDITLLKRNIRSVREVTGRLMPDGSLWPENLQATRYFWAPNAYGLKAGEGYYQNLWVLFNQASVGITDNFSIGLGTVPLFFFGGTPTPAWLTPKLSFPVIEDKFNIGAGALVGTILGQEQSGFGIVYGVTTFGSRDRNINLGLGYGYAGGSWANSPTINVSGIFRTGRNGYLLTENYYIDAGGEGLALLSLGGRRMIRKFGIDFGGFIPVGREVDQFLILPWLGFSVPFGR